MKKSRRKALVFEAGRSPASFRAFGRDGFGPGKIISLDVLVPFCIKVKRTRTHQGGAFKKKERWNSSENSLGGAANTMYGQAPGPKGKAHKTTNPMTTVRAYTYDENGNMTSDNARNIYNINYFLENRPYSLSSSGKDVKYLYNESGTRIYKKVMVSSYLEKQEFYLTDATGQTLMIEEWDESQKGIKTRFNHLDVAHQEGNDDVNYHITDHLGNIRMTYKAELCKTCGTDPCVATPEYEIQYMAEYFAYGKVLREFIAGDRRERYLTTGNERDEETGLDNRNARLYDGDKGRFTGSDPLSSQAPDWSSYRYGFDNPVMFVDPGGMFEDWYQDENNNIRFFENESKESLDADGRRYNRICDACDVFVDNKLHYASGKGELFQYLDEVTVSGKGIDWGNAVNNMNTGIGIGTGIFSGGVGLTGSQIFKYGERINGRVVSATELTLSHAAQSMKVVNALGRVNMLTGVLGSAYSANQVITDYQKGGWNQVNGWDVSDAFVGGGGLAVSGLAAFGIVSNPVGWVVGIGTGVYFGGRLIYDLTTEP